MLTKIFTSFSLEVQLSEKLIDTRRKQGTRWSFDKLKTTKLCLLQCKIRDYSE